MVRVPSYTPQQVTQGLQPPSVRAVDSGALVEQVAGMGARGLSLYGQYRDDAESARAEEAYNKLRDQMNELTYGEKGAFRVQGANVMNVDGRPLTQAYGEQFEERVKALNANLSMGAKTKFDRIAARARVEFTDQLRRHEAQQSEAYLDQVDKAGIAKEYDYLSTGNWSQPDSIANSLSRVRFLAARSAKRNGLAPDAVPLAVKEAESGLHAMVLNKMLEARDPQSAKAYYEANKPQITERDGAKLSQMIERDVQDRKVLDVTADLVNRLGPQKDGDAFEIDKMLEVARDELRDDPQAYKDVANELKDRMGIYKAALQSRRDSLAGPMWQGILDGQITSISQLRRNPNWIKLGDQDQRQMVNWMHTAEDRLEAKPGTKNWEASVKKWMELTDNETDLLNMKPDSILTSAPVLGREKTFQLLRLQRELQKKKLALQDVKLDDKIIQETLGGEPGYSWIKTKSSNWSPQKLKDYSDLKSMLEKNIGILQGMTLNEMDRDERRKAILGAATEVNVKKRSWMTDIKIPRYKVTIDVMRQMFKEDPAYRERIRKKAMERTITEPTEAQLFTVFQQGEE